MLLTTLKNRYKSMYMENLKSFETGEKLAPTIIAVAK